MLQPARSSLSEAVAIYDGLEATTDAAVAMANLGRVEFDQNDFEPAKEVLLEAGSRFEQAGHALGLRAVHLTLAQIATRERDPERATAHRKIAEDLSHTLGI